MVIGGLALIAILAITLGITLTADRNRSTSTPAAPLKAAGEPITFNDYINSNFRAKYFNGSWFSDNQLQWRDLENNLGRYTYFEKNLFLSARSMRALIHLAFIKQKFEQFTLLY